MITIGFLELNSIAKGILAADMMLKAAEIKLVSARPSCPGKYRIFNNRGGFSRGIGFEDWRGERENQCGGPASHPKGTSPGNRGHQHVLHAFQPEGPGHSGVFSVTGAVIAADAAAKAANVSLIEIRLGTGIGGKSFVTFTGDVGAVEESVEAGGKESGRNSGALLEKVVIAHPDKELYRSLL